MDIFDWLKGILSNGTFVFIAVLAVFIVIANIRQNKQLDTERAQRLKFLESIRDNGGVLAPSVILGAKVLRSWGGGKNRSPDGYLIDYLVEVTPEHGAPFQVRINNEYDGG